TCSVVIVSDLAFISIAHASGPRRHRPDKPARASLHPTQSSSLHHRAHIIAVALRQRWYDVCFDHLFGVVPEALKFCGAHVAWSGPPRHQHRIAADGDEIGAPGHGGDPTAHIAHAHVVSFGDALEHEMDPAAEFVVAFAIDLDGDLLAELKLVENGVCL